MLDTVLDIVLALVTFAVAAVVAIPIFVLGTELFYAPLYVSLPAIAVVGAAAIFAYRFFVARRYGR
jgi:uncharacterized membrane-anchored protein